MRTTTALPLLLTPLALAAPCDPLVPILPPAGITDFGIAEALTATHAMISAGTFGPPQRFVLDRATGNVEPFDIGVNFYRFAVDADTIVIKEGATLTQRHFPSGALIRTIEGDPDDTAFGQSVDLQDNTLAVGGHERAYLFDLTTGNLLWKVTQAQVCNSDCQFGELIRINHDTVAVGATHTQDRPNEYGAIFFFERETGSLRTRTIARPGTRPIYLGAQFALGDTITIAAGESYLIEGLLIFDNTTGEEIANWNPPFLQDDNQDTRPYLLAITGDRPLIADDNQVYMLSKEGRFLARLPKPANQTSLSYGETLLAHGQEALVGDLRSNVYTDGAAYIINTEGYLPCRGSDLAPPYGERTFADIVAYLNAFTNEAPEADLASRCGRFTFADIGKFLDGWLADCYE